MRREGAEIACGGGGGGVGIVWGQSGVSGSLLTLVSVRRDLQGLSVALREQESGGWQTMGGGFHLIVTEFWEKKKTKNFPDNNENTTDQCLLNVYSEIYE